MQREIDNKTLILRLLEAYPKWAELAVQTPEGVVRIVAEGEVWRDWRLAGKPGAEWLPEGSPWTPNLHGTGGVPDAYSSRWLAERIDEGTFLLLTTRGITDGCSRDETEGSNS